MLLPCFLPKRVIVIHGQSSHAVIVHRYELELYFIITFFLLSAYMGVAGESMGTIDQTSMLTFTKLLSSKSQAKHVSIHACTLTGNE